MRARGAPPALTAQRLALALPLALAAAALLLQLFGGRAAADASSFALLSDERAARRRHDALPRLEAELARAGGGALRRADLASQALGGAGALGGAAGWAWPDAAGAAAEQRIAFTVTTAEAPPQISLWLAYHRALGVSAFYLFVEGQAATPAAVAALRAERGVRVVERDAALLARHNASRIWGETWLSAFFNKPCNHELFVTQSLNMEAAIGLAAADGARWLLHVDTDELVYPGGSRDYSLAQVLARVPEDVDLLVLPNYEAMAERPDVEDPFSDVTLFKRNYAHIHSEDYFKAYGTVARGNPNYFTAYGNGKSAARVTPGLRPNGAHRWQNYERTVKEWESDSAAVLHYTYNRFADLRARRDRCECRPTEADAARCFILAFDRAAFIAASLKDDAALLQWYRERLVWEDGAAVADLLQKGLFVRLYAPQVLLRGLQEARRRRAAGEAGEAQGELVDEEAEAGGGDADAAAARRLLAAPPLLLGPSES
jgi:hypothetical protein